MCKRVKAFVKLIVSFDNRTGSTHIHRASNHHAIKRDLPQRGGRHLLGKKRDVRKIHSCLNADARVDGRGGALGVLLRGPTTGGSREQPPQSLS
jgi:hypothetical protein